MVKTNLEIAQQIRLLPISDIACNAELTLADFDTCGRYKGKLTLDAIKRLSAKRRGKLVLVTAMTPTKAGEGKTTVSVGLAQALNRDGTIACPAIREPSLGPLFGKKGGGCGGGYSQVLPMDDINMFFTGDSAAISAAHNLLSAMVDAHIHHGNELRIDIREKVWPRATEMNDRPLRNCVIGLGHIEDGVPREDHFVITAASEVMATLCMSGSLADLKSRLSKIIVGHSLDKKPVTAGEVKAVGAMTALLCDAIRPNIVQNSEGGLAFVHGGPFANIAHGCSSVLSIKCALGLADFVVTEGGFAADLGGEKFLNLASRSLGFGPDAIVVTATIQALMLHGGSQDADGVRTGMANLKRHLKHLSNYGLPVIVGLNIRSTDSPDHIALFHELCKESGIEAATCDPWNKGGEGCKELAQKVADSCADAPIKRLYDDDLPLKAKIEAVAVKAYGAESVTYSREAERSIKWAEANGYGNLNPCMAKTQYSLSDDPTAVNAPTGFEIHVREVYPSAGAGFMVVVCGDIMLLPGLGKSPAAVRIDCTDDGIISGIF